MRVLATVRCPVVQFNPVQQPVMAYGIVPNPVIDRAPLKWPLF
jgi:hypothetical protein